MWYDIQNEDQRKALETRIRVWIQDMESAQAPMPMATLAALPPTEPPPRIATLAGATPGTPRTRSG